MEHMTRTEARKIARFLTTTKRGSFVRLVEEFDTGRTIVTYRNACGMERTVETMADWAEVEAGTR